MLQYKDTLAFTECKTLHALLSVQLPFMHPDLTFPCPLNLIFPYCSLLGYPSPPSILDSSLNLLVCVVNKDKDYDKAEAMHQQALELK